MPGHATVVSYLALFVAIATGGAYAAQQIGSDQIQAGAVLSRHIADSAIRNRHIRPGQHHQRKHRGGRHRRRQRRGEHA